MHKGFDNQVYIGEKGVGTSVIASIFLFALFSWPAFVWDNGFTAILVMIGLLIVYFMPSIQCVEADINDHNNIKKIMGDDYDKLVKKYKVKHPKQTAVIWINLLFGWTVIGWFVALAMAHSENLIRLPSGMVDELNTRAGIKLEHNQEIRERSTGLTHEPCQESSGAPAILVERPKRRNLTCAACGAKNSVIARDDDSIACDYCGNALEF